MGSEEEAGKPREGPRRLNLRWTFLWVCCVAPVRGYFFNDSCRVSGSRAICSNVQLKTVPKDVPPTATALDLSKNRISQIRAEDFPSLPVLADLDLHGNNMLQIQDGPFAGLTSLQKLTLNNNRLKRLGSGAFDGLWNLTELRFNSNNITAVSPTAFRSLTRLKVLDVSNNRLKTIANLRLMVAQTPQLQELSATANTFKFFSSSEFTKRPMDLRTLDLSDNPLRNFAITSDVFPNLTSLTFGHPFSFIPMAWEVSNRTFLRRVSTLDMSGLHMLLQNKKRVLEMVNSSLTCLRMNRINRGIESLVNASCSIPTLSTLQFRHNKIRFVSLRLLDLCAGLTQLDLSDNHIKNIEPDAFGSMGNLTVLRLSMNKLSSVPGAIKKLRNLQILDLSNNMISAVGCEEFSNQKNLMELDLHNNSIFSLKECSFKDLGRLQVLRLQSNHISDFSGAFTQHLKQLKRLHLNKNKLTTIKYGVFKGLRSLLNLSLHQNQIKNLERGCFIGLRNLTDIQLQSNALQQEVKSGVFDALTNLRRLDMSDNHIKYKNTKALKQPPFSGLSRLESLSIKAQHSRGKAKLPSNFLQGLWNLLRLNIRNVQLIEPHQDMFTFTPKLESLDVSSNDLQNLSTKHFSPIRRLKSLYISRTALRSLDFLTNAKLSQLEFLQGRHNQYFVISKEVVSSLPALQYLDIQYNSFMCDCSNAAFLNWTRNSNQTQVFDASNFICTYPEEFKGRKLLEFITTSCDRDHGFVPFVCSTCLTLALLLASFAYHLLKVQLYCAYYLLLAWLFDAKQRNQRGPHQYDAFISYNAHDEPWVVGELVPKLEGEQGWRLCLHHRDFEPGKAIIENITDAIYSSRKTICIISRRYLQSEWCSKEIQMASFRLFDEQKDVLILVFLEDIPNYLLSPYQRMRRLMKKKTYLSLAQAAAHPEVFWRKLQRALQSGEGPAEEDSLLSLLETD